MKLGNFNLGLHDLKIHCLVKKVSDMLIAKVILSSIKIVLSDFFL